MVGRTDRFYPVSHRINVGLVHASWDILVGAIVIFVILADRMIPTEEILKVSSGYLDLDWI